MTSFHVTTILDKGNFFTNLWEMRLIPLIIAFLIMSYESFALPDPANDNDLVYDSFYGQGNYLQHANFIDPEKISLILEIGSRDAIDAIQLGHHYRCPVYAFECNPVALEICYQNTTCYPYVTVVPYACWNETREMSFYPVVQSHGGSLPVNIGASSLLIARQNGCDSHHAQGDPIIVHAVRLDEWLSDHFINKVDLICMDTQGATLQVLEGMGKYLNNVKYIITEVYLHPSFEGESLYPEIKKFLGDHYFYPVSDPPSDLSFCDLLFINSKI
ncbi:MAG: FkbM family methyltransferase [Parachlamydia sp.]|nr:FkbM family methyltransferase [Parachlamydia sp.]